MASLFKRFKKNLPLSTSKGSAYYKRENIISNYDDLKKVLEAAPGIPEAKTAVEISFNTIPLNDISIADLKKRFDNPSFIYNNENIEGHTVLFYKDSVAYYKFLIQYHFINNKFFFAGNKISSMGVLNDEDKQKIIGRISKKYLKKDFQNTEGWKIKVIDPNGSIIHTIDDVYFHLYYLAGNKTTQELIEQYAEHITEQDSPTGFKESLDQYI